MLSLPNTLEATETQTQWRNLIDKGSQSLGHQLTEHQLGLLVSFFGAVS